MGFQHQPIKTVSEGWVVDCSCRGGSPAILHLEISGCKARGKRGSAADKHVDLIGKKSTGFQINQHKGFGRGNGIRTPPQFSWLPWSFFGVSQCYQTRSNLFYRRSHQKISKMCVCENNGGVFPCGMFENLC